MMTLTVPSARLLSDLRAGDLIVAIDAHRLAQPREVETPRVATRFGGPEGVRLVNALGTSTEWMLYPGNVERVTIERPGTGTATLDADGDVIPRNAREGFGYAMKKTMDRMGVTTGTPNRGEPDQGEPDRGEPVDPAPDRGKPDDVPPTVGPREWIGAQHDARWRGAPPLGPRGPETWGKRARTAFMRNPHYEQMLQDLADAPDGYLPSRGLGRGDGTIYGTIASYYGWVERTPGPDRGWTITDVGRRVLAAWKADPR